MQKKNAEGAEISTTCSGNGIHDYIAVKNPTNLVTAINANTMSQNTANSG